MITGNISVGGVLIIDDTEKFGTTVGDVVMLELSWPDFTTKIRARLVGANMQRRHLQFIDFHAQAFLRISKLIKPGYAGARFHRVRDENGQLNSEELWLGPTGETLNFSHITHFAELSLNNEKILFKRGSPSVNAKTGNPIAPALLDEILVMVTNFPESTERVKELLEIIEVELRALSQNFKKTGTGA